MCARIKLDTIRVASDIERYITTRVDELSWIEGFNVKLREYTQDTLSKRAQGTFLYMGFAVNELSQKNTCTQVIKALENLPNRAIQLYA